MTDRITKVILRGDISGLKASMKAAGASVSDVTKRITDSSKESAKWRQGLTAVGSTAGKMGLVAAAGLGAIIVATANFDKSMSAVQAATHESAGAMEKLRQAAIKAGADTAFSATEAASGIEELAKAGVATKDILDGGLTGALDLAAAGAMGVGDAAEIAATAMTQFALDGSKVPHVADLLAAGAGKAQGSVADMGMALKQSGLVAAQTGLTIEETTGTLAAFASAGLIGSDAGTSFKTMLQSLTPTSDKARSEMDRLGISAYDAQGNFVGMTKFADSLRDGLKDLTVEQQNAAMKIIFGSDAVRASSVVFKQGGAGIQSWIDKVDDSRFAADTAATRLNNLSGDMEAFKGSLETALIGSGEGAQGPLRKLVQGATGAVNAFNKLPGPLKAVSTGMLAITAVLGGGLWFTAKTLSGVAAMRTSMATLGVTAKGTATALRGAAVSAGLVGAAFVAIDTGAGIVDSFRRSSSAASSASDSFAKLKSNLEKSNVGKYADSFGVDIDRLAVDIGRFGKKGKYYGEVVDRMNAVNDGFGGKVKMLTGFLTPMIGSTEKAGFVTMDLGNVADKAAKGLDKQKDSTKAAAKESDALEQADKGLSLALGALSTDSEDAKAAMQKLKDGTMSASLSFIDFAANLDPKKMGFGDYVKSLEDMAKAQENWADNLIKATARGVDKGVIAKFKEMGPEGALRLAQLADASEAEIARVNKAFQSAERSGADLSAVLDELPASVLTEFKAHGAKDAIKTAAAVADKYDMTPDQVKTILRALDYTKPQIAAVLKAMKSVDGTTAHPKITIDKNGVYETIDGIQRKISSLHGTSVGIHVTGKFGGGTQTRSANGNIFDYYADGGVENHVAQIAPAGAMRVWAEPETGGEAYIPLATSKRDRSLDIWAETGRRLGVQGFADGGLVSASNASTSALSKIAQSLGRLAGGLTNLTAAQARFDKFSALERTPLLDQVHQQQQIRDLTKSLAAKGKDKLTGWDREAAKLELADAKKRLETMWAQNRALRAYGDLKSEQARLDKAQAAEQLRQDTLSASASFAGNAGVNGLTSAAAVDRSLTRAIANMSEFTLVLGQLKAKGAAPWLLAQLQQEGPTTAAIRLAKQYLADQSALDRVNAQAGLLGSVSDQYAQMTMNPKWAQAGAAQLMTQSTQKILVQLQTMTDSKLEAAVARHVEFTIDRIVKNGGL